MEIAEMSTTTPEPLAPPENVDAEYTTAQVGIATGVPKTVLWKWTSGNSPALGFSDGLDDPGTGMGSPHYWSFRTLMQVAITYRLAKSFGVKPRRGSLIAAGFTHLGSGGPGDADTAGEMREPGKLFTRGLTYLVGTADDTGRCINVILPDAPGKGTPLTQVFMSPGMHGDTAVIVNVNQVVRDVMHRLASGA